MSVVLEKKVSKCFVICIVLFIFAGGSLFAQNNSKAAIQHTWHAGGMFSSYYHFAHDDGEEGALLLNFSLVFILAPIPSFRWYLRNTISAIFKIIPKRVYVLSFRKETTYSDNRDWLFAFFDIDVWRGSLITTELGNFSLQWFSWSISL